jgi:hypothetical protein
LIRVFRETPRIGWKYISVRTHGKSLLISHPFYVQFSHTPCPYHLGSDLYLIILELDVPFPLLKDSLIELEDGLLIL